MDLHGIMPPLTTPFATDGSVSLAHLRSNIVRYNQTRLTGYVLNGSTGESVLLRWDEVYRIWEAAREAAAPGRILIAGTGAEATAETIEHTRRAATLGFHAALVRTPHFYKPQMTSETLAAYYLRVAEASPIPILIYSVPVFTNLAVEAPLVARLAAHPNILGMKDSSGNVEGVGKIIAAVPKSFGILVGSAATLLDSLERGAVGGILALACAFPELCLEVYEAFRAGDRARREAAQQKLLAPAKMLGPQYGIPGLKYALDRLGYYGGPARPPLLPLTESAHREIDSLVAGLGHEAVSRASSRDPA